MISHISGDLFDTYCECIVNPVNCVGVMGAGIALHLKIEAPSNFDAYKEACDNGLVVPGKCLFIPTIELPVHIGYICNFPTKNHWKEDSREDYIIAGLKDMVEQMHELDIHTIAIPALGCGLGRLSWDNINRTIVRTLSELGCNSEEDFVYAIYEPYHIHQKE